MEQYSDFQLMLLLGWETVFPAVSIILEARIWNDNIFHGLNIQYKFCKKNLALSVLDLTHDLLKFLMRAISIIGRILLISIANILVIRYLNSF